MIYYPFFPSDYACDTAELSDIEDLMYRRLLDSYYIHELPLSTDSQRLYRSVRAFSSKQRQAVDHILNSFFVLTDDGYCNSKADKQIEQYKEISIVRRKAGLISAEKKKLKAAANEPTHVATDVPTLVHSKGATQPPTKHQLSKPKTKKTNKNTNSHPFEFDLFKAKYPDREGTQRWKMAADSANARMREGHEFCAMVEGAARYAEFAKATNMVGGRFVMQAATFLGPGCHFTEPWAIPSESASPDESAARVVGNMRDGGFFDD